MVLVNVGGCVLYNKSIMPSAVVRGRERLIAGDALGSLTRRCNQLRKKRFFVQPMEVSGYSSADSAPRVTQAGASSRGHQNRQVVAT